MLYMLHFKAKPTSYIGFIFEFYHISSTLSSNFLEWAIQSANLIVIEDRQRAKH